MWRPWTAAPAGASGDDLGGKELHFHGHVYGRIPYTNRRIDVGVDAWGFAPVRLENVIARLKSAPESINPEQGEEVPDNED